MRSIYTKDFAVKYFFLPSCFHVSYSLQNNDKWDWNLSRQGI